ncbi:MAG: glycosyltransferase [Parcubacteria group bacterium]
MDEKKPEVSVLMSAYNEEKYVSAAIESILDQTYRDFELIVIDDCSRDATWKLIAGYAGRDPRVRASRNEKNLGISSTLNKGLALARGKYIVKMDADDWSYPDRLEKQVRFMEKNPQVAISGGTMEVCDEGMVVLNKRPYNLTDREIRRKIFLYNPFCHPAVIYRTDIAKRVGGYCLIDSAGDYELYFKLGLHGEFANLPDVLLKYRVNRGSISVYKARSQERDTLYVRLKAVFEYGYRMRPVDKLYFACQFLSMYLIPQRTKAWIFNRLRSN